jgi:pyruvate dehydrogenase E2 component (dihydrolipoamide acetyltransferase)
VKALLGVLAEDDVTDEEIDSFVASYVTPAVSDGDEAETGPKYEFVETPLGTIRYAARGEGASSIVLIHGFGGDLDNWLFNIDALAEGAKVYALDLPGHGQSSKSLRDPTLAGLSKALIAIMDQVGIEVAHLVGHSMGGAVALRTAVDVPSRVKSLSLVCAAGLGPEINGAYIDGFVSASSRRDLKPVLENLFADRNLVSRQMVDDVLKYKRLDGVDEALKALSAALFRGGMQHEVLASAVRAVTVPILVIWGEEDRIIPAAHAQALGSAASVKVIAGAGHMVQLEAANAVNSLLKQHLAGAG